MQGIFKIPRDEGIKDGGNSFGPEAGSKSKIHTWQWRWVFRFRSGLSTEALHKAAGDIMARFEIPGEEGNSRRLLILHEGIPLKLAGIKHEDGWECLLFIRAAKPDELEDASVATPSSAIETAAPASGNGGSVVKTYHIGFAFEGIGEDARLEYSMRPLLEDAVLQAFPDDAQRPEITLHADTRVILVKARPEQQQIIAELISSMKESTEPPPIPKGRP